MHVFAFQCFAVALMWSDVNQIRKFMNPKEPTQGTWILLHRIKFVVYMNFFSGDQSHPKTDDIHQALSEISTTMLSEAYPTFASGMSHLTPGEI